MDFVKHHKNQKKGDEKGNEDDSAGCAIKHRGLKQEGLNDAQNDVSKTGDDANNS